MCLHAFVDESARRTYLLCVVVAPKDARSIRQAMRRLVLGHAERLHMSRESPSRKREILTAVCAAGVSATVYTSRRKPLICARMEIIHAVVPDLLDAGVTRVTIEEIAGVAERDNRAIHEELAKARRLGDLAWEHLPARSEPLLWVSDAIAWAWGREGDWRRRAEPVVTKTVDVDRS